MVCHSASRWRGRWCGGARVLLHFMHQKCCVVDCSPAGAVGGAPGRGRRQRAQGEGGDVGPRRHLAAAADHRARPAARDRRPQGGSLQGVWSRGCDVSTHLGLLLCWSPSMRTRSLRGPGVSCTLAAPQRQLRQQQSGSRLVSNLHVRGPSTAAPVCCAVLPGTRTVWQRW